MKVTVEISDDGLSIESVVAKYSMLEPPPEDETPPSVEVFNLLLLSKILQEIRMMNDSFEDLKLILGAIGT